MPPLAERLRPTSLDQYIGQRHLVAPGAVLREMIDSGHIASFILWGPPGVGKTTLAQIIAHQLNAPFYTLSAVNSGVKEVREVIDRAAKNQFFGQQSPILFIDEIHRFSKSQQDSLLSAVETGTITLIGATTENPSFEVIRPLLSRCQVYTLKSLDKDEQKNGKYIRQERYAGSMSRSFYVGESLRPEDVKGKFENGILQISMPKAEQRKLPATTTIAIE